MGGNRFALQYCNHSLLCIGGSRLNAGPDDWVDLRRRANRRSLRMGGPNPMDEQSPIAIIAFFDTILNQRIKHSFIRPHAPVLPWKTIAARFPDFAAGGARAHFRGNALWGKGTNFLKRIPANQTRPHLAGAGKSASMRMLAKKAPRSFHRKRNRQQKRARIKCGRAGLWRRSEAAVHTAVQKTSPAF